MRARTRWILALFGSAVLMVALLGVIYGAFQFANKLMYDACIERNGRWDDAERRCYLPSKPQDR